MNCYTIKRTNTPPPLTGDWGNPRWATAPSLNNDHFHDKSTNHRPQTQAKLLYDQAGLSVIFQVHDQFVRCVETTRNGCIWADSCVECFLEPIPGCGYFNIEINCGGTLLLHYNAQLGSVGYEPVQFDDSRLVKVKIYHSLPAVVEPELVDPITWIIEYFLPHENFEAFIGPVLRDVDTVWRANFFKCGDDTSHPHWAMWNPIPGELGFHKPEHFGQLHFE